MVIVGWPYAEFAACKRDIEGNYWRVIELAPAFAASVAPGAVIVLAGLLDSQADAVIAAYEREGASVIERGAGEWRVLVLEAAG
jgi:hypothetical protein